MEEDDLDVSVSESEALGDAEQHGGRQPATNPFFEPQADPGSASRKISDEDLQVLKGRFPHLADFSDAFLMSRTTDELLRIESTSMKLKDAERGRDVEDRLHANKSALGSKITKVPRGTTTGGTCCTRLGSWGAPFALLRCCGATPELS
jgi:hypothetical protein